MASRTELVALDKSSLVESIFTEDKDQIMDKYTKVVLTVIAVCLVIQTARDVAFVEPAYANQIHKIAICREDGSLCAGVDGVARSLTARDGGGKFVTR